VAAYTEWKFYTAPAAFANSAERIRPFKKKCKRNRKEGLLHFAAGSFCVKKY